MFEGDALPRFEIGGAAERVVRETFAPVGMPFEQAVRLTVTEAGQEPWTMQLQKRTETAIQVGDVILASFWIRAERSTQESGEGQTEFVLELAKDPWSKSVSHAVRVGREWQEIHIPFMAKQTFEAGQAQVIFRLGYQPQILEMGGFRLHNFRRQLEIADLPMTKISYRGREAEAPWRAAAQERIEKHRKGDLMITVRDKQGKPVRGAEVHVEQLNHAFWFGTAVQAQAVIRPEENAEYLQKITQNFNSVVLENNLKWPALAGDWGSGFSLETGAGALDWARGRGLRTRGHVLVWPSFRNLPKSLGALRHDKVKLKQTVEAHVREVATHFAGRVEHWDVVNEPYDNHDLMDILGDDVMVDWFRIAREADPKAKLFLNDYGILSGGGGDSGHRQHFEKTIRFLVEKGAPLDGIGMQGHFGTALTAPEDLLEILERYAVFKKPILVTEYDITAEDPELAADYTRDFFTLLFSHPTVEGIFMWGFYDGKHWKRAGTLYDTMWKLKLSGKAYQDLVLGKWLTRGTAKTDEQGRMWVRGFLGDYSVKLSAGTDSKRVKLTRAGANVELVTPAPAGSPN